jgi:hypothetical protein
MTGDNYGISHSGQGDIGNSGIQAFGPHARATGTPPAETASTATELIDELTELIRSHANSLSSDQRDTAREHLDAVAKELAAPDGQRDLGRISRALTALGRAVGAMAVLATKVESLRQAVAGFLH